MTCRLIEADLQDLELLMDWRMRVLDEVFPEYWKSLSRTRMEQENRRYYRRALQNGSAHAYFLHSESEEIIGCGTLCLHDEMPSPDNPSGSCACLMNIYIRKEDRNRGFGHFLVGSLIERCLQMKSGKIYLETSQDGRPVYQSLGFVDMKDMMIFEKGGQRL